MSVATYLAGGADAQDISESECKQYIGDHTAEEAYAILQEYNPVMLSVFDVTDATPDGVYIDMVSE